MGKQGDDLDEEAWLKTQRAILEAYLRREDVNHLGVGDHPAFCVAPYVALWAVQSKKIPGAVGWWAISGDLPTDYISSSDCSNPRDAIRAFARQWREVSACMLRGERHPVYSIGNPTEWPELGELLKRRAAILADYAADDDLWLE